VATWCNKSMFYEVFFESLDLSCGIHKKENGKKRICEEVGIFADEIQVAKKLKI